MLVPTVLLSSMAIISKLLIKHLLAVALALGVAMFIVSQEPKPLTQQPGALKQPPVARMLHAAKPRTQRTLIAQMSTPTLC